MEHCMTPPHFGDHSDVLFESLARLNAKYFKNLGEGTKSGN